MRERHDVIDPTAADLAVRVPGFVAGELFHFRHVSASRLARMSERPGRAGAIEFAAMVVAQCWLHELWEIEAEWPDEGDLGDYADEVQREFSRWGLPATAVSKLSNLIMDDRNRREEARMEAVKLADFTVLPTAGSTS